MTLALASTLSVIPRCVGGNRWLPGGRLRQRRCRLPLRNNVGGCGLIYRCEKIFAQLRILLLL